MTKIELVTKSITLLAFSQLLSDANLSTTLVELHEVCRDLLVGNHYATCHKILIRAMAMAFRGALAEGKNPQLFIHDAMRLTNEMMVEAYAAQDLEATAPTQTLASYNAPFGALLTSRASRQLAN